MFTSSVCTCQLSCEMSWFCTKLDMREVGKQQQTWTINSPCADWLTVLSSIVAVAELHSLNAFFYLTMLSERHELTGRVPSATGQVILQGGRDFRKPRLSKAEIDKRYWARLKQDPERYHRRLMKQRLEYWRKRGHTVESCLPSPQQ